MRNIAEVLDPQKFARWEVTTAQLFWRKLITDKILECGCDPPCPFCVQFGPEHVRAVLASVEQRLESLPTAHFYLMFRGDPLASKLALLLAPLLPHALRQDVVSLWLLPVFDSFFAEELYTGSPVQEVHSPVHGVGYAFERHFVEQRFQFVYNVVEELLGAYAVNHLQGVN